MATNNRYKQPMKRNQMFLGFFAEPNGTGGRVSCPQVNLKNLNVENARIIGSQARANDVASKRSRLQRAPFDESHKVFAR